MVSAQLVNTSEGFKIRLTETRGKVTWHKYMDPDDAAFLFFDLDEALRELRQKMPAPR